MNDATGRPNPVPDPPKAGEALWTATERLRALEEAAPVGIVALDQNECITIHHDMESRRLFGWCASEVQDHRQERSRRQ